MDTVLVRKRKRPDGSGLHAAYVFDHDAHGHWLYSPVGCLYRGELGGVVGECHVGEPEGPGLPVLLLIPPGGWWIAAWARNDHRGTRRISVDIAAPAVRSGGEWSFVDLELDLLSDQPGQVEIEDEDEFADAYAAGVISAAEASAARAATELLERMIRRREEPFGRVGWDKLDTAIGMSLAPLTEL